MRKRIHQMELFMKYPMEVQSELWQNLVRTARDTVFGREYGFSDQIDIGEFKERVPVRSYEELQPYIDRVMKGEQNVLWPSEIKWFAKSSGTTNDKSKFIPVSEEALEECHFKGGKDLLSIYFNNYPDAKMFTGRGLTLGGSHQINHLSGNSFYGDLSAVLMQNLPFWADLARTPELSIALLDDWEEKIEKIGKSTLKQNVTNIAGVPTWTLVLFKWLLEYTGKSNIAEIWPNLELYIHGGVSFEPYREQFKELIPSERMRYLETYNASEGFFGIQDRKGSREMLLMLDYGVFFEFMPLEESGNPFPKTHLLDEVEVGKQYALVISTNAGLWRYQIGDTIKFTSLKPYRFMISGRTKHFLNAFGEEVIIENAEEALKRACSRTNASICEYTAAPVPLTVSEKGGHEWAIEFEQSPDNLEVFIQELDGGLRDVNSDYDAKRKGDLAMLRPKVHAVPEGTFYTWMKRRGKLGGQNKVPRLNNDRKHLEEILSMVISDPS